jgi:imidazolonepropionase-like amidohydrolase
MAEAGMSFRQILASLTTAPAERFGESQQLGRIAASFQADLVVLKDDPSKNIRRSLRCSTHCVPGGSSVVIVYNSAFSQRLRGE